LKNIAIKILVFVFIANLFYDDGDVFLVKRLIYSLFIYLAIYAVSMFYFMALTNNNLINIPAKYYQPYVVLLSLGVIINLTHDFANSGFNFVTLINNPYALISLTPILIFPVGANFTFPRKLFVLLSLVCFVFVLTWVIKLPESVPYHQGYITSHAIIPFFILSRITEKRRWLPIVFLALAIPFALVSGYRIVILKVLMFFALFISLNVFRSNKWLKSITILITIAAIYLAFNNLEFLLSFFKGLIGIKHFDSDDTRSFLYEEFFSDFRKPELIFGRGFLGTYFSDYFLELQRNLDDSGDFYQRFGIEVGFLQLVLKGGFFMYILYTLPLWYVAIKGVLWYANRKDIFYIAIYILTELLLMFFENPPYFSFQFTMIFFLAGYIYRLIHLPTAKISPPPTYHQVSYTR